MDSCHYDLLEEELNIEERRRMSNSYSSLPITNRSNCEGSNVDEEQWRNLNQGRNTGYYSYPSNYNLNYGTPYGGMYPMGNSMATCETTSAVYGRTMSQIAGQNSYLSATCPADSSNNMPYDMTSSYTPNISQQQPMPVETTQDGGSMMAEAGSTPPNKTVHDIEPEKGEEDGDTDTEESSGEEDRSRRQNQGKYIKVLRETAQAREEYSNKIRKLIGEINRHRSRQFHKLDEALEVLIPPNLKEKAIGNSLKQDRRLPLRKRLRPVITGVSPKQQLQEITKNLGEDAVMLLVSIGDMFINDLSSSEITAKYNIFTLNLVRNIRQIILNNLKKGVRRHREQPPAQKKRKRAATEQRRRVTTGKPVPGQPTTQITEKNLDTPTTSQHDEGDQ